MEPARAAPASRAPQHALEGRHHEEEHERQEDAGDRKMTTPGTAPVVTVDQVKMALRRVKDPELNLNIVDLGLVYDVRVDQGDVVIDMSLTSPGCPSGPEIMTGAEEVVRAIDGVTGVGVNLIWDPMWTPERIEPRIRTYLGF